MDEQIVRELLTDGADMQNMRRLLNKHLFSVGASLVRGPDGWLLATNLPSTKERLSFTTFSQAFDFALALLIERSGRLHSAVTPSEEVAKNMRGK
jgi:hypothetical protein